MDLFTKCIWLYPLKQKSNVGDIFVCFKTLVENCFKTKIVTLYIDVIFLSVSRPWLKFVLKQKLSLYSSLYIDRRSECQALTSFLALHGISHFTTSSHAFEHNDYSKCHHSHIL